MTGDGARGWLRISIVRVSESGVGTRKRCWDWTSLFVYYV